MNLCLPSLPNIARHFQVNYGVVQLVVTLYLVAMATLQLVIGPLSDRFGRRPIMLACLAIFAVASIACIFAPNVETLLLLRTCQAFASGGMVLARAVVRDTVSSAEETASRISYVTMGMALMPMLGPIAGGYLDEVFGWQSTFALMTIFGLVAFCFAWFDLAETNLNRSSSMTAQFRSYPALLTNVRFWGFSLTSGFASGVFFAFLGGGPYVATEMLGQTPSQYGFSFAIISVGYILGNFLSGRFARVLGLQRMIDIGNLVTLVGAILGLVLTLVDGVSLLSLLGSSAIIAVGNGLTLPSANAGLVSVNPRQAGSASGLGGALQVGIGALASFVTGALIAYAGGAMPLFAVMLGSAALAVVVNILMVRRVPA